MKTSPSRRQVNAVAPGRKKPKRQTGIERLEDRGAAIDDIDCAALAAVPGIDMYGDLDWLAAHYGFSPRSAMDATRYAIFDFQNRCESALNRCMLGDEERRAIAIALGKKGMTERLLLSNARIRVEATRILLRILTAYWKLTRGPGRRWFFITFMGDEGNTLEYRPELRIPAFRRRVDKMLRDAHLDAFVVIELQTLTNFPQQGHGGTIMAHAHAIAWTDDPTLDEEKLAEDLCQSKRLSHWDGAATVEIIPIKDTARHIRWRAYYLLKTPYVGKYHARSDVPDRDWCIKKATLRPAQALRLAEGLSQIQFSETVFGVHGGTELSRAWKSSLLEWHKKQLKSPRNRRSVLAAEHDVASLWTPDRRSNKRVSREPFVFHSTAEEFPLKWSQIASAAMRVLNERG